MVLDVKVVVAYGKWKAYKKLMGDFWYFYFLIWELVIKMSFVCENLPSYIIMICTLLKKWNIFRALLGSLKKISGMNGDISHT